VWAAAGTSASMVTLVGEGSSVPDETPGVARVQRYAAAIGSDSEI